jgi:chemotaxis protein MotB
MAKSRRKSKPEEAKSGAPLWMVTYGDMMTLLLCFFVLLFSFSTLDVVRFKEVIVELQGALGVLSGGPMVLNMGDIPLQSIVQAQAVSVKTQIAEVKKRVEEKVAEEEMEGDVQVALDERGLKIRFTDKALFDLGKAEIKPYAIPILTAVGEEIAAIANPVLIEGHTDDWPIHTPQFPSNWELSTARATAIIHFFIEEVGVDPARISAAGYSKYHPVAPNTSPENKAKNRRVDVIILLGDEDKAALRLQDRANALTGLETSGAYEGIVMEEGD